MTSFTKRSYLVDHVAIEELQSLGALDTQKPGPMDAEADRELREAYKSYQVGYRTSRAFLPAFIILCASEVELTNVLNSYLAPVPGMN